MTSPNLFLHCSWVSDASPSLKLHPSLFQDVLTLLCESEARATEGDKQALTSKSWQVDTSAGDPAIPSPLPLLNASFVQCE